MAAISLTVNNRARQLDVDPGTPLLWVLRDHLNLVGTKFGCGGSFCGACTVHLDGVATRSCAIPVSKVANGQIMSCAALLARTPEPSDDEIVAAMNGNLCRCGTYSRIKQAVRRAATLFTGTSARPADRERNE